MTATPTPTPQGISALLRKAGFEKSTSSATRIKGWRNHSEGYSVSGQVLGSVRVEHKTGFDRGPNAAKRREEMLGEYAGFLTAAGYHVERDELWPALNVTALAAEDGDPR
jgi:hypothetical protein